MNSTIIGQRKPKENKRKRKNRNNNQPRERSYSEGEASDYENQQNGQATACNGRCRTKPTANEANNNNNNNHKSGDNIVKGKHKSNDKNGLMFDIEIWMASEHGAWSACIILIDRHFLHVPFILETNAPHETIL